MSEAKLPTATDIQREWHKTAIRQAEFLNKLSALMNEYQAEFTAELQNNGYDDDRAYIQIDACGTWIPYHDIGGTFDVDECIKATAATIKHAEGLNGE